MTSLRTGQLAHRYWLAVLLLVAGLGLVILQQRTRSPDRAQARAEAPPTAGGAITRSLADAPPSLAAPADAPDSSSRDVAVAGGETVHASDVGDQHPVDEYVEFRDSEGRVPGASQLQHNPTLNPKGVELTNQQIAELERLVERANLQIQQINADIMKAHSDYVEETIRRGGGRHLAPGEKFRPSVPGQSIGVRGTKRDSVGVEFDAHTVPGIAGALQLETDYLRETFQEIRSYFDHAAGQ
jgi:hypothetical protein